LPTTDWQQTVLQQKTAMDGGQTRLIPLLTSYQTDSRLGLQELTVLTALKLTSTPPSLNRRSNTPAHANGNTSMDSAGVTRSSSCRLPSWLYKPALVVNKDKTTRVVTG